jgi:hypothetical protein
MRATCSHGVTFHAHHRWPLRVPHRRHRDRPGARPCRAARSVRRQHRTRLPVHERQYRHDERQRFVQDGVAYAAGYKGARDINERSYLFASGDWRQDRFSGFNRQATEAVGYGTRLIDTSRQRLAVEGGAGAKQSDLTDGRTFDEAIVRGAPITACASATTRNSTSAC